MLEIISLFLGGEIASRSLDLRRSIHFIFQHLYTDISVMSNWQIFQINIHHVNQIYCVNHFM